MLEKLDSVEWQKLRHAYGNASDVPNQIRALTANDKKTRESAMYALYGNIWHQGTVYEATSYAAPFLIELLGYDEVADKDEILVLLAHLAHGHSYKEVHQSLEARFFGEEHVNNPQYQAEMQRELYWVKRAHDAVAEGVPVYLQLLEHTDPAVRMAAPYTLSCLPERAAEILPLAKAHLESEKDPQVRASLLLCIGILAHTTREPALQPVMNLVKAPHEHPLVRLAAASSATRLLKENTPPDVLQTLAEAIAHPEEIEEAYRALPWCDGGVAADTSLIISSLGPAAAEIALAPCLEALKNVNPYGAISLTEALLALVFGDTPFPKEATVRDLTETQKTALMTLVGCDTVWTFNANMSGVLRAFGLPGRREDLRAFLEGREFRRP